MSMNLYSEYTTAATFTTILRYQTLSHRICQEEYKIFYWYVNTALATTVSFFGAWNNVPVGLWRMSTARQTRTVTIKRVR